MDIEMVILRALHIALGVFWAGAAFFLASFVVPAVRKGWPPSSAWLQSVIGPRFQRAVAGSAALTIIAGLRMMWRLSGGFSASWMTSSTGLCFAIGGLAAIASFVIGGSAIGPSATRLIAALESAERAGAPTERDQNLAVAQAQLGRFTASVRAASALLGVAVILMAVARYVSGYAP